MKRILFFTFVLFFPAMAALASDYMVPSFLYDGQAASFDEFKAETISSESNDLAHVEKIAYTAPDGKLCITVDYKKYNKFPVSEFFVTLSNRSKTEPTGIVENFKSLDTVFALPREKQAVTINTLRGSVYNPPDDFIPMEWTLEVGATHAFRTPSGRSSKDYFPFIELNFDDRHGNIVAIGWTGAWAVDYTNDGAIVKVVAGMDRTHFKLLPGEEIRQPSITVFTRDGQTRREFKTLVHRFMVENKLPRDPSGKLIEPILAVTAGGGNKTPEMLQQVLDYSVDNKLPFDTYWIDAGWYGAPHEDEHYSNCGPNWAKYVGDWHVNTTTHPTGDLLPIADAVHKAGMRFLLWFEPERMEDGAPILAEHPEYRNQNLVDYGNPEALAWIQKTICDIIAKHKIDIFRQDFNMDPGPIWNEMDKRDADRVGIAEARHITGLYQFLDDMRARFPNIAQENCASGGRRIDIEMISRAFTYCRSDYPIGQKPGDTAFVLSQNATLNSMAFLPLQGSETNCAPVFDDYAFASCLASGTVFTPTDFDGGIVRRPFSAEETTWFKKGFAVAKKMRDLSFADFYQLTDETSIANDLWCGWQMNDPAKKCGYAIIFRRADALDEERTLELGGIDANADYAVELFAGTFDGEKKTMSGKDLAAWHVAVTKRSFAVVFYSQK